MEQPPNELTCERLPIFAFIVLKPPTLKEWNGVAESRSVSDKHCHVQDKSWLGGTSHSLFTFPLNRIENPITEKNLQNGKPKPVTRLLQKFISEISIPFD